MKKAAPKRNSFRLPETVVPTVYRLTMKPNFNTFTFSGTNTAEIVIKEPVRSITLHALELEIKNVVLDESVYANQNYPFEGRTIKPIEISYDKKLQTVTFDFGVDLYVGKAKLKMEFTGKLNNQLHGFYRTSYKVVDKKHWGASTQFEATDARRAFPCWDEPDKKVRFHTTLIVPKHMAALSNMPVDVTIQPTGDEYRKMVCFKPTPPMSTYLAAFVVADLEYIEATDKNGVLIRVYTTPGKKEHGKFALDVALHTLPYYADYYKTPYPLPKLDLVAIPDFGSGAMENWGLEIFRETALLVDEKNSSASARERVADVVDHELAHHWFGNLVTMKWWTHLWLNEGFANFVEMLGVAAQFPAWKRRVRFVAEDLVGALHDMDKPSSHPIEVDVNDPAEIREIFDTTTYSGGGSVNRMIEHYLGNEFPKGITKYLDCFKYGNAATEDLWKILGKSSGKPVSDIMGPYTRQAGYPVIFTEEGSRNGKSILKLEQMRFLMDGSIDETYPLWNVPIGVMTPATVENPKFMYMKGRRMTIPRTTKWVKLNAGQSGLYRVAYSPRMWDRVTDAVRAGEIPEIDRIGLLDDAFALARAGYVSIWSALGLLDAHRNERETYVWAMLAGKLNGVASLVRDEDPEAMLAEYARKFFKPLVERVGWDKKPGEGNLEAILRGVALSNLGAYGDEEIIAEARKRLDAFIASGTLDPDIRQTVYTIVAQNATDEDFEKLMKVYDSTDMHEEKVRVLRAIAHVRRPELIRRVLNLSLSLKVRSQDTPIVLSVMAGNDSARRTEWEFIMENWGTLLTRGGGLGWISRVVRGVTEGFKDRSDLARVEAFFKTHSMPGLDRAMQISLQMIKSNMKWLNRNLRDVESWLTDTRVPLPASEQVSAPHELR